jgi:hypothetical protein
LKSNIVASSRIYIAISSQAPTELGYLTKITARFELGSNPTLCVTRRIYNVVAYVPPISHRPCRPLRLNNRDEYLQKQVAKCVAGAQEKMKKKDKKGALLWLKKKKNIEKQIDVIMGTMMTMEQQKMALESASTNTMAVDAIAKAQRAIKANTQDVDDVTDLMDSVHEQLDDVDEVSSALAQMGEQGLEDDDDIMAEFNAMEEEALNDMLAPPATNLGLPDVAGVDLGLPEAPGADTGIPALPAAPAAEPVAVAEDSDAAALRELEAAMAM